MASGSRSFSAANRLLISRYAATTSASSSESLIATLGLIFTCRMYRPAPVSIRVGSGSDAPWKNPTEACAVNAFTYANGASSTHTTGQPSCRISPTSAPHARIRANQCRAMACKSGLCLSNQRAIASSFTRAPEKRRIWYGIPSASLRCGFKRSAGPGNDCEPYNPPKTGKAKFNSPDCDKTPDWTAAKAPRGTLSSAVREDK